MTKDKILAMDPGRELDSLFHAHVVCLNTFWNTPDQEWVTGLCGNKRVPNWSTDKSLVVDVLNATDILEYYCLYQDTNSAYWCIGRYNGVLEEMEAACMAKTIPEVICKVALLDAYDLICHPISRGE